MSSRPVFGMLLLLLLSSLSPLLSTPALTPQEYASSTTGRSAADVVIPAGADLAMFLDMGPTVLDDGSATAEVEGLFDDLEYESIPHAVDDVVLVDGYACALTLVGGLFCFNAAAGGGQSLMGQNQSNIWGTYSQGYAPISVNPEVGQAWTSIHAGRGGDSEWICAVDDANAISCWGNLGMGDNGDMYFSTVSDSAREPVVQLELGNNFGCALFESGRVGCFGDDVYAAGSNAWGYAFNASLRTINIPSNVTVAELVVGGSDVCARGSQDEFLCWGSFEASTEPEFDSMFATLNSVSPILAMISPISYNGYNGKCYLFDNGSVGCHNINSDSAVRGTTSLVSDDGDMSFVDLPNGTTATDLWMSSHYWGHDTIVCADLDDGTFACWGSEYNLTSRSWTSAHTPYRLDVPVGTERVFVSASYEGGGPVLAIDGGDQHLSQQMLSTWGTPTNRSSSTNNYNPGGPTQSVGWVGVDFAGNNLVGQASTLGVHNLTLWVNGTQNGDTSYPFSVEVVDPFAEVDPIFEYEIGRYTSQKLVVDDLCNPTEGMNCAFFFWPAAPEGIRISTWDMSSDPMMMNGPPSYEPSVTGMAKGNKINTAYTIVVQQWANTFGHHASPFSGGSSDAEVTDVNTMTVNVTLRPSTQSVGSVAVASGFPFSANADNLLPFLATSESFELDGDVPGFNLDIETEVRSFDEVSSLGSAVCASGVDGTSCFGGAWSLGSDYAYPVIAPAAEVTFGNDVLLSPIDANALVNASLDDVVQNGPFACWTTSTGQVECASSDQAMGDAFSLITDNQTLRNMGGAMAPTALWDGAETHSNIIDLSYQGAICGTLDNGTLVCRVNPSNPVLSTAQGTNEVWFENANVSSMSMLGDMLCVVSGDGALGEGLHCASRYNSNSRHLVDQSNYINGEFNSYIQPNASGSNPSEVLTSLHYLGGLPCAQMYNDSLYCFSGQFGSVNSSRNYGALLNPIVTVPGLGTVVESESFRYYTNGVTCVLDDDGDVFCVEYKTPYQTTGGTQVPEWWADLGTLVYNETVAEQWSPDEEYSFKVYEMNVGGAAVDMAQTYENLFVVLDDGSLVALGARPSQMGIGEGEFVFGVDSEPVFEVTSPIQVNPTIMGLTISGTPPAGYGTSPEVRVWGNSSYGSQTELGTQSTWDGESDNVYPFVLDYVHAVAFEGEYLEVLTTGDVSIPVDVTCTWCTTFTFQPELPGDWTFDALSGTITGTPGAAGAAVQYTVTASAANGSDTTDVRIRMVDDYTVPSLEGMTVASSSQASPVELVAGTAMTPIQLVDAESVTSRWSVTPNLPVGVHLNEETGEIFGTPAFLGNGPVAYVINASSPMGTSAEITLWLDVVDELSSLPDFDQDGTPDETDTDDDNDGVNDDEDAFPYDANEWSDLDGDGIGDNGDDDADGDGVPSSEDLDDLDPAVGAESLSDMDNDGVPDDEDDDIDGDGVLNDADAFPLDGSETADLDGDGIGDNSDQDADGDGISKDADQDDMDANVGAADNGSTTNNGSDNGSSTNNGTTVDDLDGDGTPDAEDDDIDGDGIPNSEDSFPEDKNEQRDLDGDGVGDNADDDADGDGIPASEDQDDFDASVGRFSNAQDVEGDGGVSFLWVLALLILVPLVLFFVRSNKDEEPMPFEEKPVVALSEEE